MLSSLEDSFANQKVSIEHPADGQALLTFRLPGDDKNDTRVLIDVKRNVVLSIERRNDGKTTSTQQFGDFTEVAGAWWAGTIKSLDDKGRVTSVTSQKIVRLDNDRYTEAMAQELARPPSRCNSSAIRAKRCWTRRRPSAAGKADVRRPDHALAALCPQRPMDPRHGAPGGGRKARRRASRASAGSATRC